MIETAEKVSDMYSSLGLCFDYPSTVLVKRPAACLLAEIMEALALATDLESLKTEVQHFTTLLLSRIAASTISLVELQIEYTRLFVGPDRPGVSPFESVQRGGSQQFLCTDLAALYGAEGLTLASGFKDPPDHISVELEFLAHLHRKEIEALENQQKQRARGFALKRGAFMEEHVSAWVPAFAQAVETVAVIDFYRSLARITRQFVLWDRSRL
jgi:putative dimethyl sulfoxide reductase chaperone